MFLVCGEALFDVFAREREDGALELDGYVGGSPFNVAVGLARLGSRSALLAGISNDLLGRRLAAHLRAERVDPRYLVRSDRRTTLSLIANDRDGVPAYTFYGADSADRFVSMDEVPPLTDDIRVIHCGSYTLVTSPFADMIGALVAREHAHRLVSLDPNIRPNVEPDMRVWRARLDDLLPRTDLVKVSVEDLAHLYPGRAPDDVCVEWLGRGPVLVILTRGHHGATAWGTNGSTSTSAPAIDVVDTVGAGDAFQATMLHWLAHEGRLTRAAVQDISAANLRPLLEFACAAAADTCTRRGGDLYPIKRQHPFV